MNNEPIKNKEKKSGRLPTFIIIGAMKCGTTSLHEYLAAHPDISMSKKKELDFFIEEKNYNKGLGWYKIKFRQDATVCGESSPNYTKCHIFKGVPERIHTFIPDAKLIYVVRDPIQRIISHWHHGIVKNRYSPDPDITFGNLKTNNLVLTSQYDTQLKEFLKFYPIERILILSAENLKYNRQDTLRRTFEFLDVDKTFDDESFQELFHVSAKKKIEENGKSMNLERPVLDEEWTNKIKELLEPHIKEFRSMTGKKFESWNM